MAVGLHATSLGGVSLGKTVVILGAGCIGLVTLLSAKARGAANIVVADLYDKRLEFAKEMGATHTINVRKEDVSKRVREIAGDGPILCLRRRDRRLPLPRHPFWRERAERWFW